MDTGDKAYGDNERLSFLGELTLNTTVTDVLFKHRPTLRAQEIVVSQVESVSDPMLLTLGLRRRGRRFSQMRTLTTGLLTTNYYGSFAAILTFVRRIRSTSRM